MSTARSQPLARHRGMVLVTTLLLLVIVTLLALAMFRGAGLEYQIAGNVMDKQRALQAADSAEAYGEQWLIANAPADFDAAAISGFNCIPTMFTAATQPQICSNTLESSLAGGNLGSVPWQVGGGDVGLKYNPGNDIQTSSTGGQNKFADYPVVYISRLGYDKADPNSIDFAIDAWSYGGSQSTVAVLESTYRLTYISSCAMCP